MITIWKYKIIPSEKFSISMPADATVLSVGVQDGEPHLWAMVDTERPYASIVVYTFGTGHPIPPDMNGRFVGTFMLAMESLVFHVFVEEQRK